MAGMAQYPPRRAPNVSQYIANLNAVPSSADMAAQADFTGFDDDLALFTNTDFFDFDLGASVSDIPAELAYNAGHAQRQQLARPASQGPVPNQQAFYHTFNQYPSSAAGSLPPSPPNGLPYAGVVQQSQPTIPSPHDFAAVLTPHVTLANGPQPGTKRKAVVEELEEESRAVAEEDKRRRNTAASARFRVKKKQREQALEKTAKEMSDRVQVLEARIGQLEMENQWLKGLITEKNDKFDGIIPADVKAQLQAEKKAATASMKKDVAEVDDDEDEDDTDLLLGDEADAEAGKRADEAREESGRIASQKKRGVGTSA